MRYYLAPLEGITTHIYRREHALMFSGADKYFAPFVVACQTCGLKGRELRDILPENCRGYKLVPQLLSNDVPSFISAAEQIAGLGYSEVNLNLGCPSGTVVSKKRGAGFLSVPDELDAFLGGVFSGVGIAVSVKTRIGLESGEEFERLLGIFGRYPISELIIHPRVRSDFYNGKPDMGVFSRACERIPVPVGYNGDLFSSADCGRLSADFPGVSSAMLGRGVIANPALIRSARGGAALSAAEFREFHDRLLEAYRRDYSGDRNVLFRMKELWYYMAALFPGSGRELKAINKTQNCADYILAVDTLMRSRPFDPAGGFGGQDNSAGF
jgi:tRNA-dihydrouridine synthase